MISHSAIAMRISLAIVCILKCIETIVAKSRSETKYKPDILETEGPRRLQEYMAATISQREAEQ